MSKDAIALLKLDHKIIKGLFSKFEKSNDSHLKGLIAEEAIRELTVHDAIEEEIFYPALREALREPVVMENAEEEHHVIRVAIAELDRMESFDERFAARFALLAEIVCRHFQEEEAEMLTRAKQADIDLMALGDWMMARKQELQRGGRLPQKTTEELFRSER